MEEAVCGTSSVECFGPVSRALVRDAAHSASFGYQRSALSGNLCLSVFRAQPLFQRQPIWHSGGFFGRNRLDRLCLPKDAFPKRWVDAKCSSREVVGALAPACRQLSRDCHSTRQILVAIFRCVRLSDDRHASANRVDLHEHEKHLAGAVDARKFDRLSCLFQSATRDSFAGSHVVCALWDCSVACRSHRCEDVRQAVGAARHPRAIELICDVSIAFV
jgi:hypothetical protein